MICPTCRRPLPADRKAYKRDHEAGRRAKKAGKPLPAGASGAFRRGWESVQAQA